jgi:hypothetical protein
LSRVGPPATSTPHGLTISTPREELGRQIIGRGRRGEHLADALRQRCRRSAGLRLGVLLWLCWRRRGIIGTDRHRASRAHCSKNCGQEHLCKESGSGRGTHVRQIQGRTTLYPQCIAQIRMLQACLQERLPTSTARAEIFSSRSQPAGTVPAGPPGGEGGRKQTRIIDSIGEVLPPASAILRTMRFADRTEHSPRLSVSLVSRPPGEQR